MPHRFTFLDVLVGIGLGLFAFSIAAAAQTASVDAARRARCASNLHQIGLALILYENENHHAFPRTIADASASPTAVWGTPYQTHPDLKAVADANSFDDNCSVKPEPNDVTASLFLLIREEGIMPMAFVCPSSGLSAFDLGERDRDAGKWTNWPGKAAIAAHLSYSFQDPFAGAHAVRAGFKLPAARADFAVAADMNPGTSAVTTLDPDAPDEEIAKGNSFNHQQEGQNVLYADGHCAFKDTPFCGTRGDNIYSSGGAEIILQTRTGASLTGAPVDGFDSFLLPTATDVGFKMPAPLTPPSAERVAHLKAAVPGVYEGKQRGKAVTLTIDDATVTLAGADKDAPALHVYRYHSEAVDDDCVRIILNEKATSTLTDFATPTSKGITFSTNVLQSDGGWVRKVTTQSGGK